MALMIPARWRAPLRTLADLPSEDADALRTGLSEATEFVTADGLVARVRRTVPSLSIVDAQGVIGLLMSLVAQLRYRPEWTPDELAREIVTSPDATLEPGEQDALQDLLAALITLDSVITTGKATDVMSEHEHVFSSVRILTEVRPIFGDDLEAKPGGAVVVSTMRIDHHTDGELRSFYVALDEPDLRTLSAATDRALRKTRTAKSLVRSAGLTAFEEEGEDEAD